MQIGNFSFDSNRTFVVAELSANHNQDYEQAVKTLLAAKQAGADAIKLQTYTADTITIDCDNQYFQINQGTIWDGTTLYKLYQQAYTPWEWQPKLMKLAAEQGLLCFSSPFDPSAVEFLEALNVPAYKVASFEITDIPLIRLMASKKKPLLMATGISTEVEIAAAVAACRAEGNNEIIVLKCTSAYPAPFDEMNLRTIPDIGTRFGVITGISDHSMGCSAAIAAVALGARVVEKHFILDRKLGGPDSAFSMEPAEFSEMVSRIREVERALGTVSYELSPKIMKSREHSRSLFVVKDIKRGEQLTNENVRSIRPAQGLPPAEIDLVLGKRAVRDIARGTPLAHDLIE